MYEIGLFPEYAGLFSCMKEDSFEDTYGCLHMQNRALFRIHGAVYMYEIGLFSEFMRLFK